MKLPKIIYQADPHDFREITITPFGPFYKSTYTSHPKEIEGTWIPFFYIHEKTLDTGKHVKRGDYATHLCNIFEMKMPHVVAEKLITLFKNVKTDTIAEKFATLECLLISSLLGGGLWHKDEGKKLRNFLETNYPLFYKSIPTLFVSNSVSSILTSPEAVNNWLIVNAKVKERSHLITMFPQNMDSLIQASKSLNDPKQDSTLTPYFETIKRTDNVADTYKLHTQPTASNKVTSTIKKQI